jgi:protein-S-isoprenylcysteine O-methyltransferase Ste14
MTGRGKWRARGGWWVAAQFFLMAAIVGACFVDPKWPDEADLPLDIVGTMVALAGIALVVAAALELGPTLTPFPEPRANAELRTTGAYGLVRHPIYGGGILFFVGLSLVLSAAALVPTALLAALWWAKAQDEERRLAERFPDYAEYAKRTPRRLVPLLL